MIKAHWEELQLCHGARDVRPAPYLTGSLCGQAGQNAATRVLIAVRVDENQPWTKLVEVSTPVSSPPTLTHTRSVVSGGWIICLSPPFLGGCSVSGIRTTPGACASVGGDSEVLVYRPCPGLVCLVILSDRERRSPAPANHHCIPVADSYTTMPTHRTPQTANQTNSSRWERPQSCSTPASGLSAAAEGFASQAQQRHRGRRTATGYPYPRLRPHASYPVNMLVRLVLYSVAQHLYLNCCVHVLDPPTTSPTSDLLLHTPPARLGQGIDY